MLMDSLSSDNLYCYTYIKETICIAAPKTLNISQLGAELGFRHVESHFAYVHQTLTREIAVFEKVQKQ